MLEPDDGKLSCPVLRGERRSNPSDLPDVEVQIYPDRKMAEALTFQNDYLGIYQVVYPAPGKYYPKIKKELNEFLNKWLQNIIDAQYQLAEKESED
jgi:uncharacterized protein YqiB (DUF1249 family)